MSDVNIKKYNLVDIVDTLQSIDDIIVEDDGEILIYFGKGSEPMNVREFVPNSFTKGLFELIQKHLKTESDE